ncbi:hypothetical protein GCM10025782_00910 [Pedococcus ginsenosidimutans]|uniref:Uncharacterized protein n=1 Tax=Pedococcus ginsenosidimutans TaxID=490570 RepID=A0ABP8XJD6_9MICO
MLYQLSHCPTERLAGSGEFRGRPGPCAGDPLQGTPEAWSESTEEQAYVSRGPERELAREAPFPWMGWALRSGGSGPHGPAVRHTDARCVPGPRSGSMAA